MPRHIPNLKRKKITREPKKLFVLFCEGRKTEPGYFRALYVAHRENLIELQVVKGVGVPFTIAEEAVQFKRDLVRKRRRFASQSFEKQDEVWAVFDHDEHVRLSETIDLCRRHDVGIAFSNPCFELWLLLHLNDYSGLDDHRSLQRRFSSACPEYDVDRGKLPDCEKLVKQVGVAERRAATQICQRKSEGDEFGRPSTTVGILTARIRGSSP